MGNKYTTLYFDLDNTILDFTAAEYHAIDKLFYNHNIAHTSDDIKAYSAINTMYWERFERGEIEKSEIFTGRFRTFVQEKNLDADPEKLSADYFELLSCRHDVITGAEDILKYVKSGGYTVCITTNGVSKTQAKRIKESGLKEYFDYIFVSEQAGYQKPECGYFDYVIENSPEKDRKKILVIGDSPSSDILGGINSGLDTCWYNPKGKKSAYDATYTITKLSEIKSII